jgi:hypothetical protein
MLQIRCTSVRLQKIANGVYGAKDVHRVKRGRSNQYRSWTVCTCESREQELTASNLRGAKAADAAPRARLNCLISELFFGGAILLVCNDVGEFG